MTLTGLYTIDGGLERPLHASGWKVPPRVWLEGNTLRYSVGANGFRECKIAQPSAGLLEHFVRLTDSPPLTILGFAKQHGLLGLKKPKDRPRATAWSVLDKRLEAYGYKVLETPGYGISEEGGEPIRNWHFWARKFSAALAIASSLTQGRYGDEAHWKVIFAENFAPPPNRYRCPLKGVTDEDIFMETRSVFYLELQGWLALGDVSLRLDYEGNGLVFATDTLFSGLVLHLSCAVAGSGGFAICSCCGNPYSPARQPGATTRHYCTDCGRRAAVRDAVRDLRKRRREKTEAV
jgi:hypothetical protein